MSYAFPLLFSLYYVYFRYIMHIEYTFSQTVDINIVYTVDIKYQALYLLVSYFRSYFQLIPPCFCTHLCIYKHMTVML